MLRAWWPIWEATRALRRTERSYKKLIARAKKEGKSRDDMQCLFSEASHFEDEARAEREYVITKHLLRQAEMLNLPIPDRNEAGMWQERDNTYWQRTLTSKGISQLRTAIREERQARGIYAKAVFKAVGAVIAIAAGIAGAVAAVLGALK